MGRTHGRAEKQIIFSYHGNLDIIFKYECNIDVTWAGKA